MAQSRDEHTVAFLRRAAAHLREMAEAEPGLAYELRHIASQLEVEASDMEADD